MNMYKLKILNFNKNINNKITIGYLSWKRQDIFKQTLESHKQNGLFDIVPSENRIIFFQEISNEDKDIAKLYNCKYIGNKENIGILNAFIELVEACKTEYFIFCENDFILMENNYDIIKTINDTNSILKDDKYAQIKLSNYKNPGFLYINGNNEWLEQNQENFKYKVESLSWIPNPKTFYNNQQIVNYNYEWFIFNNEDQVWSNHIYACNTNFLKNIIIPLLKHNRDNNFKLDIKYQGLESTLVDIDNIPNKNEYIINLIEEYKKRKIYSGGGNFYHNK